MRRRLVRFTPVAVALLAATAISCSDDPTAPTVAASMAALTATNVTGQAGNIIAGPSVRLTDASGAPVAGVVVRFDTTGGGGGVQFATATTDADGVASAGMWTLGSVSGVNTIRASAEGVTPIDFTATSQGGAATRLEIVAGNNQFAAPGTALPSPLQVIATDRFGNPAAGSPVTFTVLTGGGSIPATPSAPNAQGVATSGAWTLGTDPCARVQTVRAQAGTLQAVFTATNRPPLAIPGSVDGMLSNTDCIVNGTAADEYTITTTNGQAVQLTLTSGAFDALLNVTTATGTPVATNDDATGTNSSLRLITAAGTHAIVATSATAGATGSYTLSAAAASADVSACGTVFFQLGATSLQSIGNSDCATLGYPADLFRVYLPAGVTVRIVQAPTGDLDGLLRLYSPTGAFLAERDVGFDGGTETMNFTTAVAGFYTVVATSYGFAYDDPWGHEIGGYNLTISIP